MLVWSISIYLASIPCNYLIYMITVTLCLQAAGPLIVIGENSMLAVGFRSRTPPNVGRGRPGNRRMTFRGSKVNTSHDSRRHFAIYIWLDASNSHDIARIKLARYRSHQTRTISLSTRLIVIFSYHRLFYILMCTLSMEFAKLCPVSRREQKKNCVVVRPFSIRVFVLFFRRRHTESFVPSTLLSVEIRCLFRVISLSYTPQRKTVLESLALIIQPTDHRLLYALLCVQTQHSDAKSVLDGLKI